MGKNKNEDASILTESSPKKRKVPSGPVKDKARTMARLVAAVGKVIQKHGYPGLTLVNIGKESGLDRKLVYTYFGSVDNLVEAYIREKDFWNTKIRKMNEKMGQQPELIGKDHVFGLLEQQFDTLFKDRIWQRIIHWELAEESKVLKNIAAKREQMGEQILEVIDQEFIEAGVDIRARLALQIAGINYLILHSKSNGSKVCGIDIKTEEGKERIKKAVKEIIYDAYAKAGIDK